MVAAIENLLSETAGEKVDAEKLPENDKLPENLPAKLPPSERDFEIYQAVALQNQTTRAAAQAFGVSQTRVRQVIARVIEFLCLAVPPTQTKTTKEQRLYVAEQIGRMQLEHLYSEAMQMWEKSQRGSSRLSGPLAQVSFLNQAMKICMALSKVPVHPLPEFREELESEFRAVPLNCSAPPATSEGREAIEGMLSELLTRGETNSERRNSPPVGACSKPQAKRGKPTSQLAEAVCVTESARTSCAEPVAVATPASQLPSAPAQNEPKPQQAPPDWPAEIALPPLKPTQQRKLNRHERRARQRKLAEALKRQKAK